MKKSKFDQTKMILEWCAVFLLMFHDPGKIRGEEESGFSWVLYCMNEANKYPKGSYTYHFWWSLRYWDKNGWFGWRQNLQSRLMKNKFLVDVDMGD